MDRSNSLNGNIRSLYHNPNSPHQKLTLRLTTKPLDSSHINRIPSNTTLLTNPTPLQTYSQVKRSEWRDMVSPRRQFSTSPVTLIPISPPLLDQNQQTIVSSKITKSYLSSSTTYDWERECRVLKQTIENQKEVIRELRQSEEDLKKRLENEAERIGVGNTRDFKSKLEETEERMGEENAYLRECMIKLQEELENSNIQSLAKELSSAKVYNKELTEQLYCKRQEIRQISQKYSKLLYELEQQSVTGGQVASKLQSLQENIFFLESENRSLHDSIDHLEKNRQLILKVVDQQKRSHKQLLTKITAIQKQRDNFKDISEQLQKYISKLKKQNISLNKSIQSSVTPRSITSLSSSHIQFHLQREKERERQKSSLSRFENKSMSKISTRNNINNQEEEVGEIFSYINKVQQFNSLLNSYYEQINSQIPTKLRDILTKAEYFSDTIQNFLNQQIKSKQMIEKYKKLVDIVSQNQNYQYDGKISDFVNDLIEKCNLLESSLQQKKSTIEEMNKEITELKKETQVEAAKTGRHSRSQQQDIQRSRLIYQRSQRQKGKQREIDKQLNQQLNNRTKSINNMVGRYNEGNSTNLQKLKQFKPSSFIESQQFNNKLKNISGESILKQMESKLKVYQGQIVPKLQAQISQYKGMITHMSDQKDKYVSNESVLPLLSDQSKERLDQQNYRGSRMWSHSFDKRKERALTIGVSQPFQKQCSTSALTKPETSDSGAVTNSKKKRLDLIDRSLLNKDIILTIILKLVEVAQTMTKNSNFMIILPDSIYIINYSEDSESFMSAKLKVLESSKVNTDIVKKYWPPEIAKGESFGQMSIVWNLGLIFKQIIIGRESMERGSTKNCLEQHHSFFINLIERMLEPEKVNRIKLSQLQQLVLKQQKNKLK